MAATGSLPIHVLPLVVGALIADGLLDVEMSGWVGSACTLGQLAVVIVLPLLRVRTIGTSFALIASITIVAALTATSTVGSGAWLLAAWFATGLASGTLMYLGVSSAAREVDLTTAFGLRLCVSLVFGGVVILGLATTQQRATYKGAVYVLAGAFVVATLIGYALYRPGVLDLRSTFARRPAGSVFAGLAILLFFFVGQVGFWAFVLHMATRRGLAVEDATMALGLCKLSAGLAVLGATHWIAAPGRSGATAAALLLLAAIGLVHGSDTALQFAAGVLVWELSLNLFAFHLQAAVANLDRLAAASWMSAAVMLGSTAGPIVYGAAISHELYSASLWFTLATAALAMLWLRRSSPVRAASA